MVHRMGLGEDAFRMTCPTTARVTSWFGTLLASILPAWVLLAPALAFGAPLADEASRERARELGYSGMRAYAARDYVLASEQLEQAFAVLPVPSLGLWSARALGKLGKLVEAEQRYRAVSGLAVAPAEPAAQHEALATAQLELGEIQGRVPRLSIRIVGAAAADVLISIDDVRLAAAHATEPQRVNPGRHVIAAIRGGDRSEVAVTSSEGRADEVVLRFTAPAASVATPPEDAGETPAPSLTEPVMAADSGAAVPGDSRTAWRTAGWIGVAVGGAALVTSAVTYGLARDRYDTLNDSGLCTEESCTPEADLGSYDTLRTLNLVTLIAGAALGAGGAAILIIDPGAAREGEVGLALSLSPGGAALSGCF